MDGGYRNMKHIPYRKIAKHYYVTVYGRMERIAGYCSLENLIRGTISMFGYFLEERRYEVIDKHALYDFIVEHSKESSLRWYKYCIPALVDFIEYYNANKNYLINKYQKKGTKNDDK